MSYLKHIVPYEQSEKLRELGFDEECLHSYTIREHNLQLNDFGSEASVVQAPTYDQSFDWFEMKYGLSGEIQKQAPYQNVSKPYWWFMIQDSKGEDVSDWQGRFDAILEKSRQEIEGNYVNDDKFIKYLSEDGFAFINRMEARLACLEKLIELCAK